MEFFYKLSGINNNKQFINKLVKNQLILLIINCSSLEYLNTEVEIG